MKKIAKKHGKLVALMCLLALVPLALPFQTMAQSASDRQAAPAGTIPNGQILVKPYVIIDRFPTGTARLTPDIEQHLDELKKTLETYPQVIVANQGGVSKLRIRGGCYIDPNNPGYFDLHSGPQRLLGQDAEETNDLCQSKLALARAWAVTDWLIKHGINSKRLFILDYPITGMRLGGHLLNQAVVSWLINPGQAPAPEATISVPNCTPGPATECPKPVVVVNSPCPYTTDINQVNGIWVVKVTVTCPEGQPAQNNDCPAWDCSCKKTRGEKAMCVLTYGVIIGLAYGFLCIDISGGRGAGPAGDGGNVRVGGCWLNH